MQDHHDTTSVIVVHIFVVCKDGDSKCTREGCKVLFVQHLTLLKELSFEPIT